MHASPLTWFARFLWFTLPLTLGDLLAETLTDRSTSVRLTAMAICWAVWVVGLLASVLMSPATLTVLRTLGPLPLVAGVVAATDVAPSALGWAGLATAAAAAVCCMAPDIGMDFINAASYGDERRFPLRPPAALLFGPIEFVWAVATLPLLGGLLAVAAEQWLLGAALIAVGSVGSLWASRTLIRLTGRWIVFVPAGITLVDPMSVMDPTLMRREDIVRLGPAPSDTTALDLTSGAAGLILQVDLAAPVTVAPTVKRHDTSEERDVTSVLIAPTRPGALLSHADGRSIAVART